MLREAAAFCLVVAAKAQPEIPTFQTSTRLVEFTLVALDKKGNPVKDLRAGDITILDNGKPRPVAFFRFEGTNGEVRKVEALAPNLFTNRVENLPGPPRNITALVLDVLNTGPQDNAVVRAQVLRYLRALTPETRVAVYCLGQKLTVIHDFTADTDALRARLRKADLGLTPQAESDMSRVVADAEELLRIFSQDAFLEEALRSEIEAESVMNARVRTNRVTTTLSAMEALGRHLSGIPGRKNLVWISAGISMLSVTGEFGIRAEFESFESAVRKTSQRLAQEGVTLYIVDARGIATQRAMTAAGGRTAPLTSGGRFGAYQTADEISNDTRSTMDLMATVTGGRAIRNTNDLASGLRQTVEDLRGAYSVAFYSGEEPDGKWHSLKVRVNRDDIKLQQRAGYLAEAAATQGVDWNPEQWQAAISNPLGSSAILLNARFEPATNGEPGAQSLFLDAEIQNVYLRKAGDRLEGELDVVVAEKTSAGMAGMHKELARFTLTAPQWKAVVERGLGYQRTWNPGPQTVAVRVLVRDRLSGRYGTLDLPLRTAP